MTVRRCVFCLALLLTACGTERLTGLAAQDAARQYQSRYVPSDSGPIIFIDGVETPGAIALKTDPATIDSVVVLKEKSAKAAYGPRGRHGVILIYLKPAPAPPLANDACCR